MRRSFMFAACCAAMMMVCGSLQAQKKSETKLYKTVMAQGDTVAFNKFLAKYPKSVYAAAVQAKKDSLILIYNTTVYTQQQANGFFMSACNLPADAAAGKDFVAFPFRKNNVEYLLGVLAPNTSANGGNSLRIVKFEQSNGGWNKVLEREESRYIQDDELKLFAFSPVKDQKLSADELNYSTGAQVQRENFLHFNYINFSEGTDPRSGWENNNVELISNLLSISGENLFNTMFSGEKIDGTIYGSCSDSAQGGIMGTPQINYLVTYLSGQEYLKPSDKGRELTKEAIKWWYSNNKTGASALNFGVLEEGHPIVEQFKTLKTKEISGNNSADFFDIMSTTVLCVYNKANNQYILVWCEPQSKDPKKEKTLSSIYFEKGNTLVLYYYQGNKTFKERINLGTRQKR